MSLFSSRGRTPQRVRRPIAGGALCARLLALALGLGAFARLAAAGSPPVRLYETVPIETRLGNPELPSAQSVWLETLRGAQSELDLEHFYLSTAPNQPLEPVLDAIRHAAMRGVHVRLLLDARMHGTYPQPADSLALVPDIEVRTIDFGRLAGGVQHAKFFLVDRHVVLMGSQNLDWRALLHIHEIGIRVDDPRVAAAFQPVFEADWALGRPVNGVIATSRTADSSAARARLSGAFPLQGLPIVVVQSPGDTVRLWPTYNPRGWIPDSLSWDEAAIRRLLDGARNSISIQVLTYSPTGRGRTDSTLDQALRRAAARGVHVSLVISDWEAGSEAMKSLQSLSAVSGIAIRLSRLPAWSGGYISFARVEHCKYAVVDGSRAWIGTSNWEPEYFHATRNLGLVIENQALAQSLERVFAASWGEAAESQVKPTSEFPARAHGEIAPVPAGNRRIGAWRLEPESGGRARHTREGTR